MKARYGISDKVALLKTATNQRPVHPTTFQPSHSLPRIITSLHPSYWTPSYTLQLIRSSSVDRWCPPPDVHLPLHLEALWRLGPAPNCSHWFSTAFHSFIHLFRCVTIVLTSSAGPAGLTQADSQRTVDCPCSSPVTTMTPRR